MTLHIPKLLERPSKGISKTLPSVTCIQKPSPILQTLRMLDIGHIWKAHTGLLNSEIKNDIAYTKTVGEAKQGY
jgi:hypothetical protein